MENSQKLTKKEKKELRKLEWEEKAKKEVRNQDVKKYSIWAGVIVAIILGIGGLVMLVNSSSGPSSQAVTVSPVSDKDITKGDLKSKVTLIEYADYQCPACATYDPIVNQILEEYKDKILYVFRMFPLTNIHPNAQISAQAAYAALKQDKFFEMDDLLYETQDQWSTSSDPTSIFMGFAKDLKLDTDKFQKDLKSNEAKSYVNDSESRAISDGISSTPTFILNGVKISNPSGYDEFKKIIEDELNKK